MGGRAGGWECWMAKQKAELGGCNFLWNIAPCDTSLLWNIFIEEKYFASPAVLKFLLVFVTAVLLKGSGEGMAEESLYLSQWRAVPTAVEISLCSGPVPESCLKSSPRLRAISLSSSPKPPEMGLIAFLPKSFSCALEIGWFSLIILIRGHRAMVAAEVASHRDGFRGIPGMGSLSERDGILPSSVCLEKSVIKSDSYTVATKCFSFTTLAQVAVMALEVFFQFWPVCLAIAIVKLWNIPHSLGGLGFRAVLLMKIPTRVSIQGP